MSTDWCCTWFYLVSALLQHFTFLFVKETKHFQDCPYANEIRHKTKNWFIIALQHFHCP